MAGNMVAARPGHRALDHWGHRKREVKPEGGFWNFKEYSTVTHYLKQSYTSPSKVTPPNPSYTVHKLGNKYINVWAYWGHSCSDHHRDFLCNYVKYSKPMTRAYLF